MLGWALKMGKLYAIKEYVERFRRNDEETAAAAALELSNIDAAQEERVLEKESANSLLPRKSPREKRAPKSRSRKTSHQTPPVNLRFI